MKLYTCVARERMSCSSPTQIEANSPSEAAYKLARQMGYQVKQTIQGRTYSYISETCEFDGAVPLCIAVTPYNGKVKKTRYYAVRM